MNKDKQRTLIAEACGWKNISDSTNYVDDPSGKRLFFHPMESCWEQFVPNYPEDLNAVHEAECLLVQRGKLEADKYFRLLTAVVVDQAKDDCFGNLPYDSLTAIATAAQRAEAFLRTIGKWEDSQ